jgi:hypothetical protein
MALSDLNRVLKALLGRLGTSDTKRLIEELGAETINVAGQEVWTETPLPALPADAVTAGTAEARTLFVLTEDPTVAGSETWIARATPGDSGSARLADWIPPDKFGVNYTTDLFDNLDVLITVADQINNGVFFDHKTGVLTVDNPGAFTTPFKITAHRYIGTKGVSDIDAETNADNTRIGIGSTSGGADSFAGGDGATASGPQSTATGAGATAGGSSSSAYGQGANAPQVNSSALGKGAQASGQSATSTGSTANASMTGGSSYGQACIAAGLNATAGGQGAR